MSAEPEQVALATKTEIDQEEAKQRSIAIEGLKGIFANEGIAGVIVLLSAANVLGPVARHLNTTQ